MLKEKLKTIPHLPGSYQMRNINNTVIYVGKAKDLYKRVNSYFKGNVTGKTAKMVSEVVDFTYITTSTEQEAFILELNLIKEYDPKYNILLKDDKSYPYIEYISKPYPKLKVSRYLSVKKKDKKLLFGPYPNAYAARKIVNLINRLYPLKKCEGMPKNVCLYFHIGECLGYCEKNVNQKALENMEKEILEFLRGNDKILIDKIIKKIEMFSNNLNFETALELKKELDYIKVVLDKQKVELHDYINRDVIGFDALDGIVSVQILFIRNGKIIGGNNDKFYLMSDLEDEVNSYILKYYERHEIPKEILVEDNLNSEIISNILNTKVYVPIKGKKKNLVEMAHVNAKISLEQEMTIIKNDEKRSILANEELRKLLNLDVLDRIDSFDNSNLFGTFAVSGMVVFKNGKPAKNEYRKYKVSVDKNDDYNTMREVIYRRYYRCMVEKLEMPDLILVDGGINQINACKSILDELHLPIKVCGLRKDDHHRTNELIDGDTLEVIKIPRMSDVFHYLTRIQDEVHRYTINYHKQIRSKGSIASVLDNIEGIGKVRKKELIKKYGGIKKMKEASIEELSEIIPENVAKNLKKYLESRDSDDTRKE
ncbi:uvrABC system protein C [Firmicutes bacterium CAG:460]|jgi:excinuclease ABC subunit C|nr:uvrABC system protein C [Firmicutes bacterium CAG:460]